jgi:peptide chain release factor
MPDLPVSESKRAALAQRFASLGLKESDLEERFIRSSGPGGQHVNKTSTCVVLRHLPTGLEVRVQRERSQALNRFLARRLLADKLEARIQGRASALEQAREKIRRQKRRRSRRAQQVRLEDKLRQGMKKRLRTVRPGAD